MKLQIYRFLTEVESNDNEKLFFWFMTKIIKEAEDPSLEFTLSKYDLQVILKGKNIGAFTSKSVSDVVRQFFDIGFVTESRLIIRLTPSALSNFALYADKLVTGTEEVSVEDPKVKAIHLYLLGIFAGSSSMFYEDKFWGIGNYEDKDYHKATRKLDRYEISELLNGESVDTRELL